MLIKKLMVKEGLDTRTVFDRHRPSSEREQYILDQLSELNSGTRLLGIGNRGFTYLVTKIDDDNYEYQFGSYKKDVYPTNLIVKDILLDRDSFYVLPNKLKLERGNVINYDDDLVVVYRNGKKIYSGENDYEPMKGEDWRFSNEFGIYWLKDYPSGDFYIKAKV